MVSKSENVFWQGLQAEFAAQSYLIQEGYEIWHHRFRKFGAEIDLIVRKKEDLLVFCEIKKRRSIDQALLALSQRQKRRLRHHAEIFLLYHPGFWNEIRFDVIAVDQNLRIVHIHNVI